MVQKILSFCKANVLLFPLLCIGLWFAQHNAFTQDDAYISYNYAKWFSRGYGLVWYPGSTEFGYSNFLYTFMIGVGMLFRVPPEISSAAINTASFVVCLVLAYDIAVRVLGGKWVALLPILLLVTHHTFTSYATGGLETMWVAMLILAFYWHILTDGERDAETQYLRLGTLAAVALLSRLDTAIILFPGYIFLFFHPALLAGAGFCKGKIPQQAQNDIRQMVPAIAIPLITILGFLLMCHIAYGYALPGSFYVKIPGSSNMMQYGLHYLWLYNMLHLYLPLFVPLFLLYFFARRGSLKKLGKPALLLAGVLMVWLSYIIFIGGDFMEFRLLVAVFAFYYIIVFRIILTLLPKYTLLTCVAVTIAFLLGNALHPTLFKTQEKLLDFNQIPMKFDYAFNESTDSLEEWLTVPRTNWREIALVLNKLLYTGSASDPIIATGNVGAISFYSNLKVFDILGLNSVATRLNYNQSKLENYKFTINRPGHNMVASDPVLTEQKVVLNFAFPQAFCKQGIQFKYSRNDASLFPFTRHETLFIPLNNSCYVVADYITPHPKVEQLLRDKVILRYRDVERNTDCPDWLCLR